jgi:hypothetical protein
MLLALVAWDAGGDGENWTDALNWSGDAVPTAVDDVVIGESELVIRVAGGVHARSLTTSAEMIIRGSLTVTAGVIANARITLGVIGTHFEYGGIAFDGSADQILGGTGEVVMVHDSIYPGSFIRGSGGMTLTIAEGMTVRGGKGRIESSPTGLIVNRGTISADAGLTLRIAPGIQGGRFINHGRLEAPNGVLELSGTCRLEADGEWSSLGGTIQLAGILDNTGLTLALSDMTGDLELIWGGIQGGRIETTGGARLLARTTSSYTLGLAGVHLAGEMLVSGNREVRIGGGLVLDGRITLGQGAAQLGGGRLRFLSTEQVLSGDGEIVLNYITSPHVQSSPTSLIIGADTTLTIESGVTIRGMGGVIRSELGSTVVSSATITAEGPGTLGVYPSYGASLGVFVNHGRLGAGVGAVLDVGTHASFGSGTTLTAAGGRVNVRNLPDGPGGTLLFSATEGTLQIESATMTGGEIVSLGGTVALGNFVTLDGMVLNAPIEIIGQVDVRNGLTVNGAMRFVYASHYAGSGAIRFVETPAQTLSGSGLIEVAPNGRGRISAESGVDLTISSGPALRGHDLTLSTSGTGATLRTHRQVVADVSEGELSLIAAPSTLIELQGGVSIRSDAQITVSGGGTVRVPMDSSLMLESGRLNVAEGGVLDFDDRVVPLDPAVPLRIQWGEVRNATLVITDPTALQNIGNHAFDKRGVLRDAHILGELRLDGHGSRLHLTGTTTFESMQIMSGAVWVYFDDNAVISGDIEVNANNQNDGGKIIEIQSVVPGGSMILAEGRTILVRAENRSYVRLGIDNSSVLINHGSIVLEARVDRWRELTDVFGKLVNHGTIQVGARCDLRVTEFESTATSTLSVNIETLVASDCPAINFTTTTLLFGSIQVHFADAALPLMGTTLRVFFHPIVMDTTSGVAWSGLSSSDLKVAVKNIASSGYVIVTHIADFNNDLTVNDLDIFAFLNDWFAGRGDFDGNGERTVSDIFVFLSAWYRA